MSSLSQQPIGIFDSGVGGLTVYKALRSTLPRENFVYLGDTARLPYGTKSSATVADYTLQAAKWFEAHAIKMLVVACNTATAQGLATLTQHYPELPCVDVISPGAEAAAQASRQGSIAVLATEGTTRSGAYVHAIKALNPQAQIQSLACNLLVALAEEGWNEGAEATAIIRRYLSQLHDGYDTLVLGCTHFPMLKSTIQNLISPTVQIVDSASTTAIAVKATLAARSIENTNNVLGDTRFYVTDAPERFSRLAVSFLGHIVEATSTNLGQNSAMLEGVYCLDDARNAAANIIKAG